MRFIRGNEIVIYSRPEPDRTYAQFFSLATFCFSFAAIFINLIPRCQRIFVKLKLLN